jgi:hypothetical protein
MTSVSWSDLSKAAGEAGFSVIPVGTYDVVLDSATVKPTSGGKNSIAARFKVENGPHQGSSIFNNFVLSPDSPPALAFFFRHMNSLGLGREYFAANPTLERVSADLIGRRCQITVSIREWQGTQRNQVDSILSPAGGSQAPTSVSPASPAPATGAFNGGGSIPSVPSIPNVPPIPPTSAKPAKSIYEQATGTPPPPPPAPPIGDGDDLPF